MKAPVVAAAGLAAASLTTALLAGVVLADGSLLRFDERPPPPPAGIGTIGIPAEQLRVDPDAPGLVRVPFPGGMLVMAVAGPAATLVPSVDDADRRLLDAAEGAEVRSVAWTYESIPGLGWVVDDVERIDAAVIAGGRSYSLRSPLGIDYVGSGSLALVVPAGAELSVEIRFEVDGEDGVVSAVLEGPRAGEAGPAEGLRDGIRGVDGRCRVRDVVASDEPGPPPPVPARLSVAVLDSAWWPDLGFAGPGRTWRAVRVVGAFDRLDPDDLVDTATVSLPGARRVRTSAANAPFAEPVIGASGVFDVATDASVGELEVTSADGDVTVTCQPPGSAPPTPSR